MALTWKEKIMDYLERFPGATDKDLRIYYKTSNQVINMNCRQLEFEGRLYRKENPEKDFLIGNYPVELS